MIKKQVARQSAEGKEKTWTGSEKTAENQGRRRNAEVNSRQSDSEEINREDGEKGELQTRVGGNRKTVFCTQDRYIRCPWEKKAHTSVSS